MADLRENLLAYPGIRELTATKKDVQETLLKSDGQMLLNGRLYRIKAKHIGAGIYKVWLSPWEGTQP